MTIDMGAGEAKGFGDHHESESSGADKQMNLSNNVWEISRPCLPQLGQRLKSMRVACAARQVGDFKVDPSA